METTQKVNASIQAVVDYLSKRPRLMMIDGQWVPAISGRTFETVNPATEEVLTTITEGGKEDVDLAVKAAIRAFESPAWTNISAHERERCLHRIADLIELNAEELTNGPMITQVSLPITTRKDLEQLSPDTVIKTIEEVERDHILMVLRKTKGKISGAGGAAALLNIPATTLSSKMLKLNIKRNDARIKV
jgi:Aldehyde dehydrogenase family/Bacterial regulatory protein, Fis family